MLTKEIHKSYKMNPKHTMNIRLGITISLSKDFLSYKIICVEEKKIKNIIDYLPNQHVDDSEA